jgi:hypothetical protein
MIRFTQSIWTGVRIASVRKRAATKTVVTATMLTVS